MTDEPQVWHYGLMAERWAEFITDAREVPPLSSGDRAVRSTCPRSGVRHGTRVIAVTAGRD
jgi:hypothetical protein